MSARNLEDRKGHLELQRAIRNGMRLVDERTGIIQGLFELPLETNDPKFFHIAAPLTDTSRYFGVQCYRHNGGAALTKERATIAAIGEAIERYCSGMYDPDAISKARAKDLGDAAVGPWQFALFSETQYSRPDFPLSKPLESAVFGWVQGYSLNRNTNVYVPACFVYVPYRFMSRTEFVTVPISTGLACGTSLEDAILRGIYEVVERDAFSIVWLNRLNVPRLQIEDFSRREVLAVVEKFREVGIDLCINLATTDLGIPVVITLALDDTGAGPASVIAARADFDLEYAVMRSLEETAQTRLWAKKLMRDKPDYEPKPGFTDIVSGEDHVRLFASPKMRKHLEFLTEAPFITGSGSVPCPADEDVRGRIRRCVDMLSFHGYETIVVDITTPDIREAGFRVVRVLVPGLQPLDMNHNWRYLGGKRLYEAPVKMGFFEKPKSLEELNGIPHPFP
ncbi:MAG: YcaO-like family protein [Candidatus Fermentithermobacillus carboniphilus]|uniref:YcaO-like family protein n=1 Tax=Candidatus Fermentithermobacillus carboniphilus TaxID=3085328 RepID=A0AAT9LE31_9FIRM|nr:MAG: YcaO-like family protein [Candidatus Fermentithermobacillus carboniphilus]